MHVNTHFHNGGDQDAKNYKDQNLKLSLFGPTQTGDA